MSIVVASIDGSSALLAYGKAICENFTAASTLLPAAVEKAFPVDAFANNGDATMRLAALKECSMNFLREVFIVRCILFKVKLPKNL